MRSRESRNYYGSIILVFRTILVIVLLWTAMGRLMKAARAGQVRWRLAGQIAAAAMALEIVNTANRVPLLVFPYDTQIDMRVYLFTSLAEELLLLIGIGAAAALAAAIIMACYPQAGRALSRPAVDLWGRDCLPCAAALVGFYLLLRCAASQLEFHASQRMLAPVLPIPANIGTWIPFVSIVHDGALGAFFLTALLALVAGVWFRLSGHPFWRGAYAFCLLASLLPSSARHNPELLAGAIPMLLLTGTVVLMVVFLRNNLLAYPACAAALSLTRMTLLASVRGGEGLILQTLAAAALMIGALVLLSRGRRIHTSAVSRRNFMPRVR